ncbi:MAG: outer membrane protein assembly factor BamD [Flavobacteriales bacterium]
MTTFRRNLVLGFTLVALLASCSEYNKVLKSTDMDLKYNKAIEYYGEEDYYKSLTLLEELISLTRGTQRAEDVYYYYAKSHYAVRDYYLGNYYLKNFTKTFATSPRSEECLFLAAECSYQLSPNFTLDQTDTKLAIDQYQLFLDQYPGSHLKDSANHRIEDLHAKLERKDFENAKQFYKTIKYKAAISALAEFLKAYPISIYREEAHFLQLKSCYEYAMGSIEEKKLERFRVTCETYRTFAAAFPNSERLKEATSIFEKSQRQVEKYTQ